MAETFTISTVVWIFESLAPGILVFLTLKLSASFRIRNRKYSVSSSHPKYSSETNILGDAVLVYTTQRYDYHQNISVLFLVSNWVTLDQLTQHDLNWAGNLLNSSMRAVSRWSAGENWSTIKRARRSREPRKCRLFTRLLSAGSLCS